MFLTQLFSSTADALLTLVYPQACVICGCSVESRDFVPACEGCWQNSRTFNGDEAMCWKCGALAQQSLKAAERRIPKCHDCETLQFTAARACGLYEGALRASVLQLKRQPRVSSQLVALLTETVRCPPLSEATIIVPVPLHPDRERQRGFNQAAEIARALSPLLRLPVEEHNLVRTVGSDKYRAGMDSKGRMDTVLDAFQVQTPRRIQGEAVLLIDDVFTTGATASSCAVALNEAGAASVFVLTVARPR